MPLTTGINHVALLTRDVDVFIGFYVDVFDAEVLFDIDEDGLRHAAVHIGGGAALHGFACPNSPHAPASAEMFNRGHLDHVALNVADEEALDEARRRLVERRASDGAVTDFGVLKSISFRDPDGLEVEVALWGTEPVRSFDERITTTAPLKSRQPVSPAAAMTVGTRAGAEELSSRAPIPTPLRPPKGTASRS